MTALEHKELKGITIKNLVVTVVSTASIVASVMTTYFGLKNDITEIKNSQNTEARINNIRLRILEDQVSLLQKEVDEMNRGGDKHSVYQNQESRARNQDKTEIIAKDNGREVIMGR